MAVKIASVAPGYVSFYISGSAKFEVPTDRILRGVVATPHCIVVTCLYWNDGDTKITLGPFDELPAQRMPFRFDGFLRTPEHRVLVSDVLMLEVLTMDVLRVQTRVRIWSNHESQPDDVVIGLG